MAVNDFIVNLVAGLSKTKSKQQIKSDAKSLGDMYVKLIGNLDMSKTRKAINAQLKGLNNLTFNITPNVNTKGVQSATKQAINNAQRVANNNKVHLNFDTSKQQLVNQIKILGRNNNKLFNNHEMTAKYNQLLNAANVAKSTGELKTLRGELSAFKTELVATNNAGMTWGSKFKESVKSYTKFFSGASLVYAISNQVRNAATEAKTLDDSLVNLQKVTDEISDRDALYKYFDKSLSKAQELNVKVGSLIDAVTELKKLGWDLDDAELGAKWANILSNVGDVDIDTAIGSIKTSIASFDEIGGYGNDQMDKKLEAYTDLINNMSNKYSIDAEGLAESIRLSAGTLTEAHMSIEQAATMFATANKYYNDPSYLGNTAKIGSLRMRASSGDTDAIEELQEMGEEVDDLATATSNLREKLMALTGVDIMEDEHTFKSYYDQLYEISQIMDKLDDTSRANVLETMFGKSRSAAGAAILSGMKESASAYEDAINSAGSATEEYQTWMTSADAACQRFSNTLTETYQSIINGNTVRDLANLGSAVLEFANNWGIVEGTLKGVIALNLGKFIATGGMALITATKQVEQYGKALQKASNVPNGNLSARFQALKSIAQATSTLTTEQLRNVLATNTLTQADRVRILQMQGMTKEMALQKLAEMNLTQATNAQTAANTTSTASTFSLKAAMTGLGATLKSVFLSNPVGIVLMGISLGVGLSTLFQTNFFRLFFRYC
ncbi:phage tail tape measure protein, partial [Roseburia intestinalis]|uniref:phage tail tape measure protein n=1 Tax=Roseburia intestinalis TaxID=166486 RepID=UPI00156DDE1A